MQVSVKTLATAVVGTASFENGLHNTLSHPDILFGMGWPLVALGVFCLAVVGLDLLVAYKQHGCNPCSH